MNVVLYMFANAANEAAREVAVIVPFGAALAARVLVPSLQTNAGESRSARLRWLRRPRWSLGPRCWPGTPPGSATSFTQPTQPQANVGLSSWLYRRHLTYGLSGYWTSSSITVNSGQQVKVRALMQYTLEADLWMAKADWYNPKRHAQNFVIMDSQPGKFSRWEPSTCWSERYFGAPARTYRLGSYTIMVLNRNLLKALQADNASAGRPVSWTTAS